MMGPAAGLAASGKIPFGSYIRNFATGRAWGAGKAIHCLPQPCVKVVAHAGITVGEDPGPQRSIEDIAVMRVYPT